MGTVRVKALSFGCLDDRPDCWYLLRIADAARILQLCNLALVESLAHRQGFFVAQQSLAPPLGGQHLVEVHHCGPDGHGQHL
jgi:hypothetical protein